MDITRRASHRSVRFPIPTHPGIPEPDFSRAAPPDFNPGPDGLSRQHPVTGGDTGRHDEYLGQVTAYYRRVTREISGAPRQDTGTREISLVPGTSVFRIPRLIGKSEEFTSLRICCRHGVDRGEEALNAFIERNRERLAIGWIPGDGASDPDPSSGTQLSGVRRTGLLPDE